MSKELLWATLIGIAFGVVIAFGIWRVNSSMKLSHKNNQTLQTPKPPGTVEGFKIILDKPAYADVIIEDFTQVSGITKSMALVAISGENEDYLVQADQGGVFGQEVELIPGVNQIKFTAFDANGAQSSQNLLVVFSSSFQLSGQVPDNEETIASSNAEIRQKVQEKVQAALNKPKAYLGSVTDIADSTIQIKTDIGEIRQISTAGSEVAVINTTGTTNKTIKLTDIAIGDYLVAMGYINSNSVLAAQRILVTTAPTEPKTVATYAKVTTKTRTQITATPIGGETSQEQTIAPDRNTSYSNFSQGEIENATNASVEEESSIIYTALDTANDVVIRSIFIVTGDSPTP